MNYCVSCDRSFRDQAALKQHQKDSPKHARTSCKVCDRYFGTEHALKQHQDDKRHHIDPPEDQENLRATATSPSTVVAVTDQVLTVSPMEPHASARERKSRQSRQTTLNETSTSQVYRTLDLLSKVLGQQAQASAVPSVSPFSGSPKKARVIAPRRKQETKTSFKFPELHQKVADAVAPFIASPRFHDDKNGERFDVEYSTSVMGRFTCNNANCKQSTWGSKVVAILIRGYARNGYSAIVFNQRCRGCNMLGNFELKDTSYIERVAYRLKKWAGVPLEQPQFVKKGPPHEEEFCEGCKAGVCPRTPTH